MSTYEAPNEARDESALGKIITFYSYKGGTGRSMALANMAWLLALNGNRVLVVDWDLEAPGLHRYFHPFLLDKELRNTGGLMEMVEGMAVRAAASKEPLSDDDIDILEYITMLECPRDSAVRIPWTRLRDRTEATQSARSDNASRNKRPVSPYVGIDLLAAGRQDGGYSRKLSTFNWIDFYERLDGRRLLGLARQQMREMYDYILIDSRTGVSDTSGICTVEMPDALVICFTLNDQSIRGAAGIAESIREQRQSLDAHAASTQNRETRGSSYRIFPVPTRVEITAEKDKREIALDVAQKSFGKYLDHLSIDAQSKYWGSVQMAYFPYYAFEEVLAVFAEKPNDLLSLGTPLKYLMSAITDGAFSTIPPLDPAPDVAEHIRTNVLNWYLRPKIKRNDPVVLAQKTYDEFDEADKITMRRTVLRLVSLERSTLSARTTSMTDFDEREAHMARLLTDRELLVMSAADGERTVRFRDVTLVEKWSTLRGWIEDDRQFLTWRVALDGSCNSWKLSGYNDSALLRGTVLDDAVRIANARQDDLCGDEREFIRASVVAREKLTAERTAAEFEAAALAEAANARNVELQSQIDKLGSQSRPPLTWIQRNGARVGIVIGVLAVGLVGWSMMTTSDSSTAPTTAVASGLSVDAQKLTDSIAKLSRQNDSVLAIIASRDPNSATYVNPSTGATGKAPSLAPAPVELPASSNAAALPKAQLLIRQIATDGSRLTATSRTVTDLVALARGSTIVRDSVRAASTRSNPTLGKLWLLYALLRAGEPRASTFALNPAEYRSEDLARVAASGTFTRQQWLSIVPVAVDAIGKPDADASWFRTLARKDFPRAGVSADTSAAIVRAAFRQSTQPGKDAGASSAAAFSTVAAWAPEAAVVAASVILSSDYRSDALVNEIGQAFSGTSAQYAGGGLQKKFYELKLPDVKEPAAAWQMWTKEHADFIRRNNPQQAAAK